jgi:hypothetical protein
VTLALILLIGFFFLALIVRSVFKIDLCAICASVTATWITLLVFHFTKDGVDPVILGILLGGSSVGLMYYLFNNKNTLQIFKFPLIISLFWIVYIAITGLEEFEVKDIGILLSVWILFGVLYFFHKNAYLRKWWQRIIECCRNW